MIQPMALFREKSVLSIFTFLLLLLLADPYWHVSKGTWAANDYDQKITDLFLSRSDGVDLKWELRAEQAFFQSNGQKAMLTQIKLHYFIMNGNDVVIRSDKAEVELSTSQIFLKGGIQADSKEGISLATETLHWDGSQRSISTSDRVIIRMPDLEICGQGLEADLNLEKIEIKADAKTHIFIY